MSILFEDDVLYPYDSIGLYVVLLGKVLTAERTSDELDFITAATPHGEARAVANRRLSVRVGDTVEIKIYDAAGGGVYPDNAVMAVVTHNYKVEGT
jgi:hypothetical protein